MSQLFTRATACALMFSAPAIVYAQDASQVKLEPAPVFQASKILPPEMLQSDLHRVRESCPTDGFMIHFTVDSDFGQIDCLGVSELEERLNELRAIKVLVETSKTDLFAEGLKKSVEAPIDAVKNIADDPGGAVKKAPATVGHFFKKVGSSISHGAEKVQDKWENRDPDQETDEMLTETGKGLGRSAKSIAGFDKAKLDCARKLSVDPYTDNQLLQDEIEKVTWAFFAGGLPLRLGTAAVSGGASMALTATKTVGLPDDIYDITPGELLLRDREAMTAMGANNQLIEQVFLNTNFSVAKRHGLVEALAALPAGPAQIKMLKVAASCTSREQAGFFYQSVVRLAKRHLTKPFVSLTSVGRLPAGKEADGSVEIQAPADYISMTPRLLEFLQLANATPQSYRAVITGRLSPAAKVGFEAFSWQVIEAPLKP